MKFSTLFNKGKTSNAENQRWIERLRFRLARPDALLPLAFLGLITGFLSGGVIVLFRFIVENTQDALLPGTGAENYEALPSLYHFLFPVIASILLAILFYKWAKGIRVLGVARVMERVAYHQGHLTLRGFIMQFIGAGIAIIGGHSVGREGPHAYLGATASSLFGQFFRLPNNSIRTLVASGAAAGIAASFNTPLAGVIFALEVIMMEYALNSFVPVMLAAVVATALSNAVLGGEPAFIIPTLEAVSLHELPIILILGVIVGAFAALFNHVLTFISTKTQGIEIWWRMIAAGLLVGLIALLQPAVLGIGYDTVNASLLGDFALSALVGLVFLKLLATSLSVGLGIPGGMIGPAFFIGATLGGAVGLIAHWLYDGSISHIGFYALLGMGAMMGASLQAPLAALTAIMELTYNPGIIMPGMLVIVVAQLTASEIFNKQSLFISLLRANGLDYSVDPVLQVLRSVGVASVMSRNFERLPAKINQTKVETFLQREKDWIIINQAEEDEGTLLELLPVSELAKYLRIEELQNENDGETKHEIKHEVDEENAQNEQINLLEIPAKRLTVTPISLQANLMEAHQAFSAGAEILCVVFKEENITKTSRIYGIITPQMIEAAYLPKSIRTSSID